MNEQHGQDDVPRLATLGERLAAEGNRLAARHLPAYPWAAGLGPVLRRAAELSESWGLRFDRHENGARPPAVDRRPGRATGRSATGTAPPPVRRLPGPDGVSEPESDRRAGPVEPVEPADPVEQILPVDVRARLQSVAGPGAAVMRVRVDPEADAAARGQRADAVTVGTEVRVRSGRYRPDTAEGFALLAHEASHVTALLGRGDIGRRSAPGGPAAEEHRARQVERAARQSYGPGPVTGPALPGSARVPMAASRARPPSPSLPAGAPPNGSAPLPVPAGAGVPMRADTDRTEAAAPPGFDMEALRRDLIDELMRRVRTDFERGG